MPDGIGNMIVNESDDILATLLGEYCSTIDIQSSFDFCEIACTYILVSRM